MGLNTALSSQRRSSAASNPPASSSTIASGGLLLGRGRGRGRYSNRSASLENEGDAPYSSSSSSYHGSSYRGGGGGGRGDRGGRSDRGGRGGGRGDDRGMFPPRGIGAVTAPGRRGGGERDRGGRGGRSGGREGGGGHLDESSSLTRRGSDHSSRGTAAFSQSQQQQQQRWNNNNDSNDNDNERKPGTTERGSSSFPSDHDNTINNDQGGGGSHRGSFDNSSITGNHRPRGSQVFESFRGGSGGDDGSVGSRSSRGGRSGGGGSRFSGFGRGGRGRGRGRDDLGGRGMESRGDHGPSRGGGGRWNDRGSGRRGMGGLGGRGEEGRGDGGQFRRSGSIGSGGGRGDSDRNEDISRPSFVPPPQMLEFSDQDEFRGGGGRFSRGGGRRGRGRRGGRGGRSFYDGSLYGRHDSFSSAGPGGQGDDNSTRFQKRMREDDDRWENPENKRLRGNPSFGSEGEIMSDSEVYGPTSSSPPISTFSSMDKAPPQEPHALPPTRVAHPPQTEQQNIAPINQERRDHTQEIQQRQNSKSLEGTEDRTIDDTRRPEMYGQDSMFHDRPVIPDKDQDQSIADEKPGIAAEYATSNSTMEPASQEPQAAPMTSKSIGNIERPGSLSNTMESNRKSGDSRGDLQVPSFSRPPMARDREISGPYLASFQQPNEERQQQQPLSSLPHDFDLSDSFRGSRGGRGRGFRGRVGSRGRGRGRDFRSDSFGGRSESMGDRGEFQSGPGLRQENSGSGRGRGDFRSDSFSGRDRGGNLRPDSRSGIRDDGFRDGDGIGGPRSQETDGTGVSHRPLPPPHQQDASAYNRTESVHGQSYGKFDSVTDLNSAEQPRDEGALDRERNDNDRSDTGRIEPSRGEYGQILDGPPRRDDFGAGNFDRGGRAEYGGGRGRFNRGGGGRGRFGQRERGRGMEWRGPSGGRFLSEYPRHGGTETVPPRRLSPTPFQAMHSSSVPLSHSKEPFVALAAAAQEGSFADQKPRMAASPVDLTQEEELPGPTAAEQGNVDLPHETQPPEPSEPSASMLALTRLLDLEAQMEYAFAKHMALVASQKMLRVQYEELEKLPVGIEAFQEELDKLKLRKEETEQLYDDCVHMTSSN